DEFMQSYRGVLILLMQRHREFQIVTPRTVADFRGDILILPDVRVLNDDERRRLQMYVASGKRLAITGRDATQLGEQPGVMRFPQCPGKEYMNSLVKDFERTTPESEASFLGAISAKRKIEILGSAQVATSIAQVDGTTHIYFANF